MTIHESFQVTPTILVRRQTKVDLLVYRKNSTSLSKNTPVVKLLISVDQRRLLTMPEQRLLHPQEHLRLLQDLHLGHEGCQTP